MFSEAKITQIGADRYNVSYGDDTGVFAQFFWDAIQDEDATRQEGRPIYRNVEMVRIMFPGDNTKEVVRKVRKQATGNQPSDIDRFARQWAAFQAEQEQVPDGTPLEHWPPLDKATILNLKGRNIHTVEQLSAMTDANLNFMGARQLRDNAKAWLTEAEAGGAVIALRNEVEAMRRQIEAQENTIRALRNQEPVATPAQPVEAEIAAVPLPESDVKPIKTRMRKKEVTDAENITGTGAGGGERAGDS